MVDIAVKGVKKAFEIDRNILDGISFEVYEGEHIGLLGKNGAGKTTLFKIIAGELETDEGDVVTGNGRKVGLISQIPVFPPHFTAEDVLKSAHMKQISLQKEIKKLELMMANGDTSQILQYDKLVHEFERTGGYDLEIQRNKIANGLEIPNAMRSQLFSSLSGGEKTRVNLARLILEETDILLLDEPTNHLDMKAVTWLEEYLKKYKGTVLIISHDRFFLDSAVTRIIEVVNGKAEFYSGNYSFYTVEKQARYQESLKRYELMEKEAARLEASANQLAMWGTGNKRLMRKSFAIKSRIERLRKDTEKPRRDKTMNAKFSERDFFSDELLVIKNLEKGFNGRQLFHDVNLEVTGGERIALIGDNGSGKTTFLNLLLDFDQPDSGNVRLGPAVKLAYLPQVISFSNRQASVLDTAVLEGGFSPQTARNRLGSFKFSGEDVFKPVSALSGGELSRLRLCILMKDEINLLILDEPTNHLDIDSREWIENALENYNEALLFVSHDRYFINRFATRIWSLENGRINDFCGSYDEYISFQSRSTKSEQTRKAAVKAKTSKIKPQTTERRLEAVEQAITEAETVLLEIESEIEANASDYVKLTALFDNKAQTEAKIDALYLKWSEIEGTS